MKVAAKARDNAHRGKSAGAAALESYQDVLDFLTKTGSTSKRQNPDDRSKRTPSAKVDLPFLANVQGIENLLLSMSAVAPAIPGAGDEEWNPLSQRPHSPLPPRVTNELGAEITALKEAVDAFTTLSHEMMHVALWEPFFAGRWRPKSRSNFREFALMAEGFCFFFSDIIVSGAVRVRLPDGEFALDRVTPSNARFHPGRAFAALGLRDHQEILGIYIDGFSGGQTALWQPRGSSNFVTALAAQVYEFYQGSLRYLNELHTVLTVMGTFTEFYRRFCAIPGLPTFLTDPLASPNDGDKLKLYFSAFLRDGLKDLAALTPAQVASLRWRRMLQMRAFYALQVRWLLSKDRVLANKWSNALRRKSTNQVDAYLLGLEELLQQLAAAPEASPMNALSKLDAAYDSEVRRGFLRHDVFAGDRWLIAPRRAGGRINVFEPPQTKKNQSTKTKILPIVDFLIDELTQHLHDCKTDRARNHVFKQIQHIAAVGAECSSGNGARSLRASRRLWKELERPHLLAIWSLPLASFNPKDNQYREILFSYQ